MKIARLLLLCLLFGAPVTAAEPSSNDGRLARLADEFWRGYLALSPTEATGVGYHVHTDPATGAAIRLDERLDDLSAAGLDARRRFFHQFRRRLKKEISVARLDPQSRADYELIRDVIAGRLLELEEIQSYRHKPQLYVETLGASVFLPLVLEYAPPQERLGHILARLEQLPAFLAAARENLVDTAPVFLETALEENKGNISLIQGPMKTLVPPSGPLAERAEQVATKAVAALEQFNQWLETELKPRATGSWRLGRKFYGRKLRYELGTDMSPEEILRDAEEGLERVRGEMMGLALPLHRQWFPEHGEHNDLGNTERQNRVLREVLDRIAEDRPRRDQLFQDVRHDVQDLEAFLREKKIVSLPGRGNLQVIETPRFLRGIYGVAGFQPAPPLEPSLGAFYFVTPLPDNWTDEQVASKLREYNNSMLKILTVHEALPGHYIQFEHAANLQPEWRRVLRSLFGNGPYVEGWATYAQDLVLQAGYREGDPRLALTNDKMFLRVLANAILDVRFHTGNMTEDEALDLMMNRTFQERAEAEGKLRRAKLSSTQLPTYFVGWREWWRLRRDLERAQGKAFSLADFHDRVLDAGAVSLRSLRRLLLPP